MKLSIITVNLDNAEGIRKTVESVVSQTFTDYEYIVVDGASTDKSVEIIKEFADNITYWVSEPDKGIYNAMNKGIKLAKGEYIQFLNSGDWFYSNRVLDNVFGQNRTEDILYGDAISYKSDEVQTKFVYPQQLSAFYLINWMICHQSIFHKRTLFENRFYDEKYKIIADWEFLINAYVFQNCSSYYLNEVIVYNDALGVSSVVENVNKERKEVLEKYFPARVLYDYSTFYSVVDLCNNSTLYPFLPVFRKVPVLQRLVKRGMKLLLLVTGNSNKIPSEERESLI